MIYRNRQQVTINAEQQPMIATMQDLIPKMNPRNREFALSLVSNFYRWGKLSEKQLQWVCTLTERVTNPAPTPTPTQHLSVANIIAMFDRAGQTLKRVKVRLQTTDGAPVVLTRAGSASKYAGQILITDGGPFGQNKYYGRIDLDGNFYGTGYANSAVVGLISEFAEQPEETAGKYGRLTGGCCFCNHSLKDDRSLSLGYGPVCAGKFGLK